MKPLTPKPPTGPTSDGPTGPTPSVATIARVLELTVRLVELSLLQTAPLSEWSQPDTPNIVRLKLPESVHDMLGDMSRIHWRAAEQLAPTVLAEATHLTPAEVESVVFSHLVYLGLLHLSNCEHYSTNLTDRMTAIERELKTILTTYTSQKESPNGHDQG